jgi:hypothetical protein
MLLWRRWIIEIGVLDWSFSNYRGWAHTSITSNYSVPGTAGSLDGCHPVSYSCCAWLFVSIMEAMSNEWVSEQPFYPWCMFRLSIHLAANVYFTKLIIQRSNVPHSSSIISSSHFSLSDSVLNGPYSLNSELLLTWALLKNSALYRE